MAQKKWENLSEAEKIETLHEEIKSTKSSTRSLKKIVTALQLWIDEIRRYLGMKRAI